MRIYSFFRSIARYFQQEERNRNLRFDMARVNLDALLQELGFRIHGLVKIVNKEEKTGSSKRDNVRAVNL